MPDEQPAFAEERRRMIAAAIAAEGKVRISELVLLLGVSEPTIRKDLDELQRVRVLRRTHGGAIAPAGGAVATWGPTEMPIGRRAGRNLAAKRAIARACLAEIGRGESVFLDSGSTVQEIAAAVPEVERRWLDVPDPDRLDINVLTNSLGVASLLADRPGIRHTLVGGQVRALGGSLVGPIALDNLSRFHVDVAFIGVSGLTADGVTVADVAEAQIKQSVIGRAHRVVVALDGGKFGVRDFVQVCDLAPITTVITDRVSDEAARWCADHDIELKVAAPERAPRAADTEGPLPGETE